MLAKGPQSHLMQKIPCYLFIKYLCMQYNIFNENSFVYPFRPVLKRSLTTSPFLSEIWDSLGKRLEHSDIPLTKTQH